MPTHHECAYFANQCYYEHGGQRPDTGWVPDRTWIPGERWEVKDRYYPSHGRWNLGMSVYFNSGARELIIAFRGTNKFIDYVSDLGIWQGETHPVQHLAEERSGSALERLLAEEQYRPLPTLEPQSLGRPSPIILPETLEQLRAAFDNFLLNPDLLRALLRSELFLITFLTLAYYHIDNPNVPSAAAFLALAAEIASLNPGVSWETINARLTNNFKEQLKKADTKKLVSVVEQLAHELHLTSITFVGHSMGGYLAEMTACRLKKANIPNVTIAAVVFDSPGSFEVVNDLPEYNHPDYNFIISYLAAPNIVNTCHHHPGEIRRIFIPHVEKGNWTWSHAVHSVALATLRTGAVASVVALPAVGAASAAVGASMVAVKATAATSGALLGGGMLGGTIGWIYKDTKWLLRQHSMENILNCFIPQFATPYSYDVMESWPYLGASIRRRFRQVAANTLKSFVPLRRDTPGLRTMFYENHMREKQVTQSNEYIVHERIRYHERVDWAD